MDVEVGIEGRLSRIAALVGEGRDRQRLLAEIRGLLAEEEQSVAQPAARGEPAAAAEAHPAKVIREGASGSEPACTSAEDAVAPPKAVRAPWTGLADGSTTRGAAGGESGTGGGGHAMA